MSWIGTFNGVFFLSLATILSGSFGLALRYMLKSKCEDFSLCCGLLSVKRRVDLETTIDMKELENHERPHDEKKAADDQV